MKRRAIIVDLDGTLCDNGHRRHVYEQEPKDWKLINELSKYDLVNDWCLEIVNLFALNGYKIIFLTGRSAHSWDVTEDWLNRNVGHGVDWQLMMRPKNDHRLDTVVKSEIFFRDILPMYDVKFAIDDRKPVVDMWRSIGVTCLDCASDT
jgi:predicted secreted acid phosphatase